MKHYIVALICCYSVFSPLHQVLSLKCRTGNQQSDDQFQKIMQVCRRRFLGYERENGGRDYNARESDSQESSDSESDEEVFDNKFLSSGSSSNNNRYNNGKSNKNGGRYDYSRNMTHQSSQSRNGAGGNRSTGSRWSSDNGQIGNNRHGMRNAGRIDNSRGYSDSRFNNNNNNNNRGGNNYNNNNNGNNDDNTEGSEHEQACVIQCFFNELNLVDQRGFPEKSAVVGIMTQNIQDPELRDFVEESVVECYHYLNNNGRQEKCQFSQNLLSCLAEKGSERCEDWDDD